MHLLSFRSVSDSLHGCCGTWWCAHVLPRGYAWPVYVRGRHWAVEDRAPFSRYVHSTDSSLHVINSYRTTTAFFPLHQSSPIQDQYWNCTVMLTQSKSLFERWQLVCFHSNTVFLKVCNRLLYSLRTHETWKRSVEKYKSYGTLSKSIHFLSVFCEADVVQQCTEAQTGLVQDGLKLPIKQTSSES